MLFFSIFISCYAAKCYEMKSWFPKGIIMHVIKPVLIRMQIFDVYLLGW